MWLNLQGARLACQKFGAAWSVVQENSASLICTKDGLRATASTSACSIWRLIVWEDGASNQPEGKGESTKAGNYYGGRNQGGRNNDFQFCGEWTTKGILSHSFVKMSG